MSAEGTDDDRIRTSTSDADSAVPSGTSVAADTEAGSGEPPRASATSAGTGGQSSGAGEPRDAQDPPDADGRHQPATRRVRASGVVIALLVGLLGFALAAQLREDEENQFGAAREGDLVQILDELSAREERLRSEIADLENRAESIDSEAEGAEAALAEARRRADELGILAGTVAAQGPGVVVTLEKGRRAVGAQQLLDIVSELRAAGVEAMQVSGRGGVTVRVVVSTYFADARDGVEVDGRVLRAPFTLTAIGDADTMATALKIPGGVLDAVTASGGRLSIDERDTVRVTAVRPTPTRTHAKPVE